MPVSSPANARVDVRPSTLITKAEGLAAACDHLSGRVGVDTEFHSERRHLPDLHLVQVHVPGHPTLLVDARAVEDLRPLGRALSECQILLHGGERDLQLLTRRADLAPKDVLDTQVLAGMVGLGYPRRLQDLAELLLDEPVKPGNTGLSDWSRRPLSDAQKAYAIADVAILHELTDALEQRGSPQQIEWALAATEELQDRWLTPMDPLQAWRQIPAARVLGQRERERLRHLAAWRVQEASQRNLMPFHVASNPVLVDMARRAPTSLAEMSANRLTPKGLQRRYGPLVIQMIAEAPTATLRPLASTPAARSAQALLQAWAHGFEARAGVAAGLVMPSWRLESLLVNWLETGTCGDLPPWLEDAAGKEIRQLLAHELALSLDPTTGTTPASREKG